MEQATFKKVLRKVVENHVFYRGEFQKQRFHSRVVRKMMTLFAENPGLTKGPG